MKSFRSLLLPAAMSAALFAPAVVFAQQTSQPPAPGTFGAQRQGQWQGHRHNRHGFMGMLRGVNLSDQQRTQLKQIMQQYREAHPRGTQMDQQARRQSHEQLRAQLMNVLTPQQRTQVEQNMQQMRERHRQWREQRQNAPSPQPSQGPQI